MRKTDNFFVIDNFNTVPTTLVEYCNDYIIYNASTSDDISKELSKAGLNHINIPRTGHNISTYFAYFYEFYDKLPDVICLTKGHMIGRHCSKEFFDRVYDNKYFTYLYEDKSTQYIMDKNSAFLVMENQYIEINNSWYVESNQHPHKYFVDFNDLLQFIYVDPLIPQYCIFSPGACYIVLKAQIKKHSKDFYLNLNKIMTYGLDPNFPVEAHMIERMLPIIFEADYQENKWMNDSTMFDEKLKDIVKGGGVEQYNKFKQMGRITKKLYRLKNTLKKRKV